MAIQPNLAIPYERFRDTHLAHHRDSRLTDPFEDPESNFLDPGDWERLHAWQKALMRANNTLAGRIVVGPALAQFRFMAGDWHAIRGGDRAVLDAWLRHLPGVAVLVAVVHLSPMPLWAYLVAAYGGLALLRIRTYLEHRAHDHAPARTVIIEDRGPLSWLFLFNSLHAVHHTHPQAAWYKLPGLYRSDPAHYQTANDGYVYRSYGQVFRRYFLSAKDPVPHPLWRRR